MQSRVEKDYSKESVLLTKEFSKVKENLTKEIKSEYEQKLQREALEINTMHQAKINQLETIIQQKGVYLDKKDHIIEQEETKIHQLSTKIKSQEDFICKLEEEHKSQVAAFECQIEEFKSIVLTLYTFKTSILVPDDLSQFNFYLDLSKNSHVEMLSILKQFKLPDCKRVGLDYLPSVHPSAAVKNFLLNSAPDKADEFIFSWNYHVTKARPDIEMYVEGLEKALTNITKEVTINYCIYSKDSLERIVKACAISERLTIRKSVLDLESDLDFSGPTYRTAYLSIAFCGDWSNDDWSKKPERFERLLKAIAGCSLKSSLVTLNVHE